ncbi:hypothetical protein SPONN_2046 [uncultured Candidatus Thioglobus sp.]|nr:hypothetical protein SPONN_2046 [uncultured Candidatus Thioglobus sp.]
MTYSEAIEKVMIDNGGFASLQFIYKNIEKYRNKTGLTPDNTIQERVQRDDKFTRIGLGVWALTQYADGLTSVKSKEEKAEIKHKDAQGMLLEIGKNENFSTYTNDKKWLFNDDKLGDLATMESVPKFTYPKIIKDSVKFADVIWFNSRGFPHTVFEVEHSTDFRGALTKFCELQDFMTNFCCVAPDSRRKKFDKEISKNAFSAIQHKVSFWNYSEVEKYYDIALAKQRNYFLK